jgi:hypothetical protein
MVVNEPFALFVWKEDDSGINVENVFGSEKERMETEL